MARFQRSLFCLFVLLSSIAQGQDFKFGKISKAELEEKVHHQDSSAAAAVLYRRQSVRFDYSPGIGFNLITNIHERVKIYNKEGFDYATVSQSLYKNRSDKEAISGLKAFTYFLDNDKIEKVKMEKSAVFSTVLNENIVEEKFTLPNIKEACVIEYHYQVSSPFYYSMDEIVLQYDIPIKKQEISIAVPEYFFFKPLMKGYLPLKPNYGKASNNINFTSRSRGAGGLRDSRGTSFQQNSITYQINTTDYVMNDVPALKEEPYINAIDNYRSAVNYELQYVQFPQETRESYSSTWEDVIKKIYASERFGGQLKTTRYFKEDLERLMKEASTDQERIAAIFKHVQGHMNWNTLYGYYAEKGVKTAYKDRSGNSGDINLILTSMLQGAGLEASPVLVSTRSNGVPMFPTREGFNYVICAVEIDGGLVLLDATNKFTKPNLLPTRALNWFGRMIKKNGTFTTLNLIPDKTSREIVNLSVAIMEDGTIQGKERKTCADYDGYIFRNKYANAEEADYLEKLENMNSGMEISEYEIKNKRTIGKPVMESFSFTLENQADVVGDKIYFSPMFHMAMSENPFKRDAREYPIDFTYPWQKKYIMNIKIPEGYGVTSKPQDINMVLTDRLGQFKYKTLEKPGTLQVLVDMKINKAVIAPGNYADLKEFFKTAVEKQTEKVVLSKM